MIPNLVIAGATSIGVFFAGVGLEGTVETNTWLAWLLFGLGAAVNLWLNINAVRNAYEWGKLDEAKEAIDRRYAHLVPPRG